MLTELLIVFAILLALAVLLIRGTAPILDFPGPPRHWLFGNSLQVAKTMWARHNWWRENGRKYGTVFYYRTFGLNVLHVSDPEIADAVFKDKVTFPDRPSNRNVFAQAVPLGLLGLNTGEMWTRHRRLLTPLFAEKFMELYGELIMIQTEKLYKDWSAQMPKAIVQAHSAFSRLTLDVIGETGFGYSFRSLDDPNSRFISAGNELCEEMLRRVLLPKPVIALAFKQWHRMSNALKPFYDVVGSIMLAAKQNPSDDSSKTMLSELLRMKDDEGKLTPEEVRDEIITIMLAGHETTANTMTWALHQLAINPAVQAKLRQEVEKVLQGRPPSYKDYPSLEYTKWVVNETLRMYPVVPTVPRLAQRDFEINGKLVPKGTIVGADLTCMQMNPTFWGDPENFRPERFDESKPENNRPRGVFMPFGGGARICVGQRFAMLEAVLVLSRAVQLFEIRPDPAHPPEESTHITLSPKNGLYITISPAPVSE